MTVLTETRLHLGCGDNYREGFVNVDLRDDCRTDLCSDVRHLPFDDGDVAEIVAEDLIEHFPADQTDSILGEWNRVLHTGGRLTIKCPNLYQLARAVMGSEEAGSHWLGLYVRNIYGGHRWGPEGAWDTHHTGWTPNSIKDTLDRNGFEVESNDGDLNMTVVAVKR